jgi:predicted membrane protein
MAKEIINQIFSTPRDGIKTANIDIEVSTGNLILGILPAGSPLLASGTLQYLEGQDQPAVSVAADKGHADLSLRANNAKPQWSLLPWKACLGATSWTFNLHPIVLSDIRVHSGGGNLQLNLDGTAVKNVFAETGGGNVDLSLPSDLEDIQVLAKSSGGNVTVRIGQNTTGYSKVEVGSGAGNVTASIPDEIPARIHAASGLGKVMIDPRFKKIGEKEYQSPEFEKAESRIELTIQSGAGNVEVK